MHLYTCRSPAHAVKTFSPMDFVYLLFELLGDRPSCHLKFIFCETERQLPRCNLNLLLLVLMNSRKGGMC